MNTWKQALWLAKFELKASIVNILFCWLFLSFFSLMYLTSFTGYLHNNYIGFDVFLIVLFSFAPYWLRSKHFQYKKVYDHVWASPSLLMQIQLPIPKNALVKSRLMIYLVYFFPFAITTFILLYVFSNQVRAVMDLPTYITFIIIWLSVSLSIGIILPASDVGDYVSTKVWVFYTIATILVFVGVILFFHNFLGQGIVYSIVQLASKWPIPSIIISIILVLLSWKFWQFQMKKTIKKLDYM